MKLVNNNDIDWLHQQSLPWRNEHISYKIEMITSLLYLIENNDSNKNDDMYKYYKETKVQLPLRNVEKENILDLFIWWYCNYF